MAKSFLGALSVVFLVSGLLGCQQNAGANPSAAQGKDARESDAASSNDAPAKQVTLEVKSWAEAEEWVQTQKGKVVVVDLWSTSCPPCIAEFPNFVALQNKYGDKIACASFSLDFTSSKGEPSAELQEEILGVLKKLSATTTNFLSRQNDEAVTAEVGVAAIPVAFIYDRQGKLHKMFTNDDGEYGKDGYTYKDHIYPVVEALIEKAE